MNPLNDPLRHLFETSRSIRIDDSVTLLAAAQKASYELAVFAVRDFGGKEVSARLRSTALFIKKGTINAVLKTSWTWYPHFDLVDLFETEAFERKLGPIKIEKAPIAVIHLAKNLRVAMK